MSHQEKIYIDGLTERQCEICDMLWGCTTLDEVKFLLDYCLTDEDRLTALTLIEIMYMESSERDGQLETVKPLVDNLIQRVMEKSKRA